LYQYFPLGRKGTWPVSEGNSRIIYQIKVARSTKWCGDQKITLKVIDLMVKIFFDENINLIKEYG